MSFIFSHGGVPVELKEIKKVTDKKLEIKNPTLEKAKKIQKKLKGL